MFEQDHPYSTGSTADDLMRLLAVLVYAHTDAHADLHFLTNLHANDHLHAIANQHAYCNPDANCDAGSL